MLGLCGHLHLGEYLPRHDYLLAQPTASMPNLSQSNEASFWSRAARSPRIIYRDKMGRPPIYIPARTGEIGKTADGREPHHYWRFSIIRLQHMHRNTTRATVPLDSRDCRGQKKNPKARRTLLSLSTCLVSLAARNVAWGMRRRLRKSTVGPSFHKRKISTNIIDFSCPFAVTPRLEVSSYGNSASSPTHTANRVASGRPILTCTLSRTAGVRSLALQLYDFRVVCPPLRDAECRLSHRAWNMK